MPATSQATQGRGLTNISEAARTPRGVCSPPYNAPTEMGTPENGTMDKGKDNCLDKDKDIEKRNTRNCLDKDKYMEQMNMGR